MQDCGTVGACAIRKAKQWNIPRENLEKKMTIFIGRVSHDLAKIKAPEELKVTLSKPNWHILVDEASGFKQSKFFETKGGIIPYMCELMFAEVKQGHPTQVLCQDNAGVNVQLVKTDKGKDSKLDFEPKFTAQKNLQQNSHAKTSFTVTAAQARLMMVAAHILDDERFKLWPEAAVTATFFNNLIPVTIGDVTQTRWVHAGYQLSNWQRIFVVSVKLGLLKKARKERSLTGDLE